MTQKQTPINSENTELPSTQRGAGTGLRPSESGTFSATDLASIKPFKPPPGWRGLPAWKQPLIIVWVFLALQWSYVKRIALAMRWMIQRLLKSRPAAVVRGLEICLWPMFFIYLSWVSNTANPFYINEGFPWPWLGVWLIALRYGSLSGAIAALVLLGVWYGVSDHPEGSFPRMYFLGGAIMTMIAGEFGSLWSTRMHRFREATRYLDDKIERLTRRLYLLKLSHDELEYELVDRPGTLRDALIELRGKFTPETLNGEDALPGSRAMLQFLAQYGHIELGAIYEYIDGPKPILKLRAQMGEPPTPDPFDPMLRRAVETGQSVHLQEHLVDGQRQNAMLLVAPIMDSRGRTRGLLVVNRMPFLALNPDNLRNIWVLLQAYSEYLRLNSIALPYTDSWPDSPLELRHEFAWLQGLQKDFGLQTWCTVWHCSHEQAADILELVQQEHASGEMCWLMRSKQQTVLISLLPFQGMAQIKMQQKRILTRLSRSYSKELVEQSILTTEFSLASNDAWAQIKASVVLDGSPDEVLL